MPTKRFYLEEVIYFVTTRTFQNRPIFKVDQNCRLFLETLDVYRKKLKLKLYAFAVLPDHVHLLIAPSKEYNISQIMHSIKGGFARRYLMQNHEGSATDGGMYFEQNHEGSAIA